MNINKLIYKLKTFGFFSKLLFYMLNIISILNQRRVAQSILDTFVFGIKGFVYVDDINILEIIVSLSFTSGNPYRLYGPRRGLVINVIYFYHFFVSEYVDKGIRRAIGIAFTTQYLLHKGF